MAIFEQLKNNEGTLSSALGRKLAGEALDGRKDILEEANAFCRLAPDNPRPRSIRAGAAITVGLVAEERPDLVSPSLAKLIPARSVTEPHARWMIIRTAGFCAHLNRAVARKAVAYAEKYLGRKGGLCLSSSADLFLGNLGSLSQWDADNVVHANAAFERTQAQDQAPSRGRHRTRGTHEDCQ